MDHTIGHSSKCGELTPTHQSVCVWPQPLIANNLQFNGHCQHQVALLHLFIRQRRRAPIKMRAYFRGCGIFSARYAPAFNNISINSQMFFMTFVRHLRINSGLVTKKLHRRPLSIQYNERFMHLMCVRTCVCVSVRITFSAS